jgi:hypothetical protein
VLTPTVCLAGRALAGQPDFSISAAFSRDIVDEFTVEHAKGHWVAIKVR